MKPVKTPPRASSGLIWAALAARLLAGLVLVASGTMKASAPAEEFALIISAYDIVPEPMALTLATFLPWAELLIGFSLIFGYFTRAAASAAIGLFAVFLAALLSLKARGIELPNCGCFGQGWHMPPSATMGMDAALLLLAILAWRAGASRASLDNWTDRSYT